MSTALTRATPTRPRARAAPVRRGTRARSRRRAAARHSPGRRRSRTPSDSRAIAQHGRPRCAAIRAVAAIIGVGPHAYTTAALAPDSASASRSVTSPRVPRVPSSVATASSIPLAAKSASPIRSPALRAPSSTRTGTPRACRRRRELVHRRDAGPARGDHRARARCRIRERRAERSDHADAVTRLEIGEQRRAAPVHLEQDLDPRIAVARARAVHRHRSRQERIAARHRPERARRQHHELPGLAAGPVREREHEPPVHAAFVGERGDAALAADRGVPARRRAHPFSTSIP